MSWLKNVLDISVDELYKDWDYNKWCIEAGWMDGPIAYANNWVRDNFEHGTEMADVACGNGQIGIGFNNKDYVIDGYDINPKMLNTFESVNYRSTTLHDMNNNPLPKKYRCITVIGAFNKSHIHSSSAKMFAESLEDDGLLIASVSIVDKEDPLQLMGWRDQTYLEIVSEEIIKSLVTIDEGQKYHVMTIFKKK
jgi:2-polyprenyl-3-methyl-5-hydroxy-6-metoxy-1,4-benzoquinol methylase